MRAVSLGCPSSSRVAARMGLRSARQSIGSVSQRMSAFRGQGAEGLLSQRPGTLRASRQAVTRVEARASQDLDAEGNPRLPTLFERWVLGHPARAPISACKQCASPFGWVRRPLGYPPRCRCIFAIDEACDCRFHWRRA